MNVLGDVMSETLDAEISRRQTDQKRSVERKSGLLVELDPTPPRYADSFHHLDREELRIPRNHRLWIRRRHSGGDVTAGIYRLSGRRLGGKGYNWN